MKDIAFGVALMILSAVMYVASLSLPDSKWEPLGSGSFPKVLFASLFSLALILIVQKLIASRKSARIERLRLLNWIKENKIVLYCFLVLFSYIAFQRYLGFIISTLLFLLVFQWMLDPKNTNFPKIALISVLFTFPVYFLFRLYLRVYLP